MVRQYYVDEITDISEQELRPLCQTAEPPACPLGGWAVHLHVNDGFREEYGREYIGSRDVDLGFHVDPDWERDELKAAPVGRSVQRVLDQGDIPPQLPVRPALRPSNRRDTDGSGGTVAAVAPGFRPVSGYDPGHRRSRHVP